MDFFELQFQLAGLFTGLNSSKQASVDICNFLIRNYVNQEDLYPVLIETLPKLDINKRLNFFQFIDDFLTMIIKDPKLKSNDIIFNYAFLIISDLNKFLQFILPQIPLDLIADNKIKRSEIRTLSNLHFCHDILYHISQLFDFKKLDIFENTYNSNLLTQADLNNIEKGELFDEIDLYINDIKPTKSSHVDDYVNSSPNSTNNSDSNNLKSSEENYIPEKIYQGLDSAWNFIIQKKKQSQYEALLIDTIDDPFGTKHIEQPSNISSINTHPINTNISTVPSTEETHKYSTNINTSKTPIKANISSSQQSLVKQSGDINILSLTQNLILQRIEADRERQKRGKETLWEVERPEGVINRAEFEYIYDTLQSYNVSEDKPVIEEMNDLYELCTLKEESMEELSSNKPILQSTNFEKTVSKSKQSVRSESKNNLSNSRAKRPRTDTNTSKNYRSDYYNNYYDYDYEYDYNYDYEYQSDWHYKNGNQLRRKGNNTNNGNHGRRR